MSSSLRLRCSSTLLRDAAVKPKTKKQYEQAVEQFLSWKHSVELSCDTAADMDAALAEYCEYLYTRDISGGKGKANYALAGVLRAMPEWKHSLPLSRQALKGWSRLRAPVSHPPLTWEVAVAMALSMAKSGYFGAGVALLLSFECYLRIGEMTSLRVSDVAFPSDARLGSASSISCLRLRSTKTGANQWVEIRDPDVIVLLRHVVDGKRADDSVFGLSQREYRAIFHAAREALGLLAIPHVPHSCRHGGATRDFMLHGQLEAVLLRGRWKSTDSARTYVQSAQALLLAVDIPTAVHKLGRRNARKLAASMLKQRGKAVNG
jgi:integrase